MSGRLPRPRFRTALLLGAAIGGIAYARYRARTGPTMDPKTAITERHAVAFLVDRRIDPDRVDEVVEHVTETIVGADPERLLGLERASTASLFLDRDEPALVWYVEVPRPVVGEWTTPEASVADAFPVSHEALSAPDEPIDREPVVHAAHPERPRRIARDRSTSQAVLGPDDAAVDVALVRLRLESGFPDRFASLSRRVVDGDLDLERVQSWSLEMLEAEAMFTESVVLERGRDGYTAVQYMEADSMERVYDAYYDTWNPVARIAELLAGRLFAEPERILEYPLGSEYEPLAHAVDPARPRRADELLEASKRRKGN